MNNWSDAALLLSMMAVTFLPRYIPFVLAGRLELPPLLLKALRYVPIAVLSALITLNAVVRENAVQLRYDNHHLLAAGVAVVMAYFTKRLGYTVLAGLVTYAIARWFIP